jgi:acetoin utilization protein AcuB
MRVRDCPLPAPVILGPTTSLAAARRLIGLHDVRHVVVMRGGQLVGTVSKRALDAASPSAATSLTVGEARGRLDTISVAEIMIREPLVVGLTTPLAEAARLMRDARADVLVVCDQDAAVGILTAREMLRALGCLIAPGGTN